MDIFSPSVRSRFVHVYKAHGQKDFGVMEYNVHTPLRKGRIYDYIGSPGRIDAINQSWHKSLQTTPKAKRVCVPSESHSIPRESQKMVDVFDFFALKWVFNMSVLLSPPRIIVSPPLQTREFIGLDITQIQVGLFNPPVGRDVLRLVTLHVLLHGR